MSLSVSTDWTLFLDRDGVINRRYTGGYLTSWDQFEFLSGAADAIVSLTPVFKRIIVVTNQQGVSKGITTDFEIDHLHYRLKDHIAEAGGKIERIYYCPEHGMYLPKWRKPNTGMPLQAQEDFQDIDFKKSIMVGDFSTDIEMGHRLGMTTVFIKNEKSVWSDDHRKPHYTFPSLWSFSLEVVVEGK